MSRKKRVLFNSISNVAVLMTNLVITFVMMPIIVRSLGNHNYGIWELLVGLVGYLGVLEFGIGPALVRYVANAHATDDRATLNQIFNTGAATLSILGVAGLLLVLVLAAWPDQFFPITPSEAKELVPLLVIFGLNMAASLPRIAFSGYMLGLQKHGVYNSLDIVLTLIQSVFIYYVLTAGWQSPLLWMAALLFCKNVVLGLLALTWIISLDGQVKLDRSAFRFDVMKQLVGYGLKNTLLRASIGMLQKLVSFAVAYTAGVAQVVYFVLANRLTEYVQSLVWTISQPLVPYFSQLAGRTGQASVRAAWVQTTRVLQVITFWSALIAVGAGEPFIRTWMGPEYAEHSATVLYILCVGLFAQSVAPNSVEILMSLGRHGRMAGFSAIYAVICFGMSIALGSVWGLEGVAMAVCLYAIGMSVTGLALACRILDLPMRDHLRANLLPFFMPVMIGGSMFVTLRQLQYPSGYAWIMLHASLASAAYLASVWFLALNAFERTFVRERMLKRRLVVKSQLAASLGGEDK